MGDWTHADPGAGSTVNVGGSLSTLTAASSTIGTVRDSAVAAASTVTDDSWSGTGVAEWHSTVTKLVTGVPDIQNAFTAAHVAVSAYKTRVESIQSQAEVYKTDLQDSLRLVRDIPFIRAPWDIEGIADDAIRKVKAAGKDFEAIQGLIRLSNERQQADETLVTALNRAVPDSWVAEHKAFVAAGITKVSQLTPTSIADAMVKLAEDVNPSAFGSESREKLAAMMDLYGDDENVMNAFFAKLGGAKTVDLVTKLGSAVLPGQDNAATLALAKKVQSALSMVSKNWSPELGAEFARDMLDGKNPYSDDHPAEKMEYVQSRAEAIGWLFSDVDKAPMGENLTVAMARVLDGWERIDHHGPLVAYGPLTDGTAGRLYALEHKGNWEVDEGFYGGATDGIRSDDASGRVLETLGHYPNAALGFLTTDRIAYWVKKRDWSAVDGFQGPAALLIGAEQVPGGPFSATYDSTVAHRVATLTSRFLTSLSQNSSLNKTTISDAAAGRLATALSPYLDLLAVDNLTAGMQGLSASNLASEQLPFGPDGTGKQWVPTLDSSALDILLGTVGSHIEGASVLQKTIDAYQHSYSNAQLKDPTLAAQAINRSLWLQGVLDGSSSAATLNEAKRHDAQIDDDIDGLMTLVGLIPVPGLGAVVKGGSTLLDVAGGAVQTVAESEATDAWKKSLYTTQSVLDKIKSDQVGQAAAAELNAAHLLTLALGADVVGPIPALRSGESGDAYAARLDEWWRPTAARLQELHTLPDVVISQLGDSYINGRDAAGSRESH